MTNIDNLIAFEQGDLDDEQTIDLFQGLINTGLAYQLQGFYGRTAEALIEAGHCTRRGETAYV
jgi:hypothetical protein